MDNNENSNINDNNEQNYSELSNNNVTANIYGTNKISNMHDVTEKSDIINTFLKIIGAIVIAFITNATIYINTRQHEIVMWALGFIS